MFNLGVMQYLSFVFAFRIKLWLFSLAITVTGERVFCFQNFCIYVQI